MADDPATGQVLLFGGATSGTASADDTWEWSGSTWVPLAPATSPTARGGAAMAYDASTGQLLLFGGATSPAVDVYDTWEWTGTIGCASIRAPHRRRPSTP